MKRVQSSRRVGEAKRRGGDRVTSGHTGVNNGEPRSERVKSISSGFTNENGFRGAHFGHIFGFEGEREILSGISGHFPDFEWIRPEKGILFRNREWDWWVGESQVPPVVKRRFESISIIIMAKQGSEPESGTKVTKRMKTIFITVQPQKGVVSPEKDMIIFHILLGGNDPFFAFGQSGLG